MINDENMLNQGIVKILLVEDDDVDVMAIVRAFEKQRIANPIVRAKNGAEALEMLTNGSVKRPYLILLDLNMPVMGGLEFLEILRSHKDLHDCVVFVLTTSSADEDISASYKQHIAGYFLKTECGKGVMDVVNVLEGYWKVVHLPK